MKEIPWQMYEIPAGVSSKGVAYEAFSVIETAVAVPLEFPARELGVDKTQIRQRFTQYGCSYSAYVRKPKKTGVFKVE